MRICGLREREREGISRRRVVMLGKGHLLVTETNRTGYVPGGGSVRGRETLRVSSS